MRIRSTKPEFWRSHRIASVDWESRFVLKGLESYVDDNGVGKDDLELIVTDLFSRDVMREPSRTLKRVQVAVNTLSEAGLVWRYEADGTSLLYISWWEQTQYINRPSKGRLPRPDGTHEYGESEIGEFLKSPQEGDLSPQTGTGNREQGTGDQVIAASTPSKRKRHSYSEDFEEFWLAYPAEGRKDKPKVFTAWKKAAASTDPAVILAGAKRYASDPGRSAGYTKFAQGWLSGERWNDEPSRPARPARASDDWMQQ